MQVFTNQPFTIDVSLDNLGGQLGSLQVEVKIGNSSLPVQTASVAGGKATTLKFQATLSETGSFPLVVNGKLFGNINTILPPQTSEPSENATSTQIAQEEEIPQQVLNETSETAPAVQREEASPTPPSTETQTAPTKPLEALLQFIFNFFKFLFVR